MEIETCRQAVLDLPVTVAPLDGLRNSARLISTHYSTQIEGNRLTQAQVQEVVLEGGSFPNRERDEQEVLNFYRPLDYLGSLIIVGGAVTETDIRTLPGFVMTGRETPTPYRDGQNVVRDSASGGLVFMPPEAKDVPGLMAELVAWLASEETAATLPAPIMAGLAHYQFATIHPYNDGNGRTARLLTKLLLHRSGYGLKGIYSPEEFYARDLVAYYQALNTGPLHNYHMDREEADLFGGARQGRRYGKQAKPRSGKIAQKTGRKAAKGRSVVCSRAHRHNQANRRSPRHPPPHRHQSLQRLVGGGIFD